MEPFMSRRSLSFIGSRDELDWFDCAMPARYARWISSFSRSVSVESLKRSGGGALAPRPGCGAFGRFSLFSESRTCGAPGPRLASLLRPPLFVDVVLFARSRMAASVPTVLLSVSMASSGGVEAAACCSPTVVSWPVEVTVIAPGLPTIGGTGGTVIGEVEPSGSRLRGPVVPSAARRARSRAIADLGTHSVSSSSAFSRREPFAPPFAAPSTRWASASRSALSAAWTLAAASWASFSAVRCWAFWRRRVAEFQRFFTAFSERPGSSLAILVHELPHLDCASTSTASSSSVQPPFLSDGSRWLNHLSLHCLPMRPGMRSAISDHLVMPASMQSMMIWSSSLVHGPLTRPGCSTFCQRWRHCTSERWSPR
mmetsp:Transcript_105987/g.306667  ORF Transcript_105987/g.306667 Transcript_105987/m.306667 type:complete len:369 (+) Transcript_105987:1648-2754(+)